MGRYQHDPIFLVANISFATKNMRSCWYLRPLYFELSHFFARISEPDSDTDSNTFCNFRIYPAWGWLLYPFPQKKKKKKKKKKNKREGKGSQPALLEWT